MFIRTPMLAAILTLTLISAGCQNNAQTGALVGGAAGAGLGGLIGSFSHARAGEGALIGGAVGALGGYIVGNEADKNQQRQYDSYRESYRPPARHHEEPAYREPAYSQQRTRVETRYEERVVEEDRPTYDYER
jgi:uncharacterized protein YcfJ